MKVVLRTARGLEVGQVLAEPVAESENSGVDGEIVRGMTVSDELLAARLEKNRLAALSACTERLRAIDSSAILLDVELLLDGRTLWFYFLGEVGPDVSQITAELAEIYDTHAQVRQFADVLTAGCGPDCGTEHAEGGGCSSCGTGCAVARACGTRKAS
jgi:cell fate regulator YaaT (PSP1 superfamily)